jgi:hypothetical protein
LNFSTEGAIDIVELMNGTNLLLLSLYGRERGVLVMANLFRIEDEEVNSFAGLPKFGILREFRERQVVGKIEGEGEGDLTGSGRLGKRGRQEKPKQRRDEKKKKRWWEQKENVEAADERGSRGSKN